MEDLEEINAEVLECQDCPLGLERNNAVPGEGPEDAEIMFIGEGPGREEDRQGRPFVGPAGEFLDGLLASIGMTRHQVYITNMIKCRPPGNRDPLPEEMAACGKYLDRQIELINPRLIVTLGRFSTGKFIPGETIGKARGKPRRKDGRVVYPVMHPAAGLRRREFRKSVIEDFAAIPEVLDEAYLIPARAEEAETTEGTPAGEKTRGETEEKKEEAQQPSLF